MNRAKTCGGWGGVVGMCVVLVSAIISVSRKINHRSVNADVDMLLQYSLSIQQ